ncbi:MAG: cell division protein FtsL [Spirochaetia bacterium]
MSKRALILIFLTLPVFLFVNVWQVYRYKNFENSIEQLEEEQQEWVEKNKRLIAGIAVLSSPERLAKLAENDLELEKLTPGRLIRILLDSRKREP